jgi:hypothetical protein
MKRYWSHTHWMTVLAVTVFCVTPEGKAARAYFTDQPNGAAGRVMSVGLDGTAQQTVVTFSNNVPDLRGIAFHRGTGRVFFLDNGGVKKIYSVLPDGSDLQEVLALSASFHTDLEIDELSGKFYWADNTLGQIRRANLDGSDVEIAVTVGTGIDTAPYFFCIDRPTGYFYWGVTSAGSGPSSFRRASFTNGVVDPNFVITTSTRTRDIGIDWRTSTAYWCDRQTGTIFKRALSGGANQTVISGMNAPHGLALDVDAEKVYWTDTGGRGNPPQGLSVRRIARCNFNGTEFENLSTPAINSEPWDMTLDLTCANYADWRSRFFSVSTPLAGPEDDFDGDGAPNLLEFALGTNPRKTNSVPLIASRGTGLEFTRRLGTDLNYTVEVSTNLNFNVWHYNGESSGQTWTAEAVVPVDSEFEKAVVERGPALNGMSNVFYRLNVTVD